MKIQWNCCKKNLEKRSTLENVLPQQYNYKVIAYDLLESATIISESKFSATIRVDVCTEKGRDGNRIFRNRKLVQKLYMPSSLIMTYKLHHSKIDF